MSDLPELSVVMSVYNNADTLAAAMDSVLAQEGVSFEFIVVDDGSTDGSSIVLDRYAAGDPRVRLVRQSNQGLTQSLRTGCSMAQASWIARQDADDISLAGRFRALMDLVRQHPGVGMVASSIQLIGPDGEDLGWVTHAGNTPLPRDQILLHRQGPPAHGCAMFSRVAYDQAGGYRSCFYYAQDSDLWLRMAERTNIVYTEAVLYAYRVSAQAISGRQGNYQRMFGDLGGLCMQARKSKQPEEPYLKRAAELTETIRSGRLAPASRWCRAKGFYYLGTLMAKKHPAKATAYYVRALEQHPLYLKAWIKYAGARAGYS